MQPWPPSFCRTFFALPPVLFLAAGCATTPGGGAHDKPQIIAHRGASAYAPENTLAAFRLAHEMGAPWYELDTMLCGDGHLVVIHDNKLDRTTSGAGTVWTSSLEYLKTLDAGSHFSPEFKGETIPTLAEALDMAKDKIGVYVEIKSSDDDDTLHTEMLTLCHGKTSLTPELAEAIMAAIKASGTRNLEATRKAIALIRERNMQGEIVIQSFSPVVCFIALQEAPDIRTELLASEDEDNPGRLQRALDFGMLINAAGFNIHHESLDSERIAYFHRHGKTVAAWTVDDPARMRELAEMGVDFIITNTPDLARASVGV